MRGDKIPINTEAKHLLLIGPTKFGKTRYAVEALNAGYELLYIDKDNGLSTLRKQSNSNALERLHYFSPPSIIEFVENLMMKEVIRWNNTTNREFQSSGTDPNDDICEIYPLRMDKGIILCIDTWTSLAWSAMETKAADMKIDLTDVDKWGREIYGTSGFRLTRIAKILQVARCHEIIMAHSTSYEVKDKPPGVMGEIKEKDMILKSVVEIPMSSSNPHGYTIGQYFNEIGWLVLDNFGARRIDFTLKKGRLGAGTPNAILDPLTAGSWASLWGNPPERNIDAKPWIEYFKASEFDVRRSAAAANAPTLGSTLRAKVTS